MSIKGVSLSSPIEKKIAWGEYCYKKFADQILKDKTIADLLIKLKSAISASHKEMARTAIADICRECEENEGGSCCGAELENRYDGYILLINLLLGVGLPNERYDSKSCFFLGESGCLLQARHVICVNYLCKKVTDRIDPHKIIALREKEGEELDFLFRLNERIKKILEVLRKPEG